MPTRPWGFPANKLPSFPDDIMTKVGSRPGSAEGDAQGKGTSSASSPGGVVRRRSPRKHAQQQSPEPGSEDAAATPNPSPVRPSSGGGGGRNSPARAPRRGRPSTPTRKAASSPTKKTSSVAAVPTPRKTDTDDSEAHQQCMRGPLLVALLVLVVGVLLIGLGASSDSLSWVQVKQHVGASKWLSLSKRNLQVKTAAPSSPHMKKQQQQQQEPQPDAAVRKEESQVVPEAPVTLPPMPGEKKAEKEEPVGPVVEDVPKADDVKVDGVPPPPPPRKKRLPFMPPPPPPPPPVVEQEPPLPPKQKARPGPVTDKVPPKPQPVVDTTTTITSRREALKKNQKPVARPTLVLRVNASLQEGESMGNRCHEQGPDGWCSPASYLLLTHKGQLELREGWEGNGKRNWAAKKRLLSFAFARKLQQKRRQRGRKANHEKEGRAKGEEQPQGTGKYELVLSSTGVLELRSPEGEWLWRSNVVGAVGEPYEAFVNDQGKLVVYVEDHVHWKSA